MLSSFEFLTNLFTELTVHAYTMFTHLKLRWQMACYKMTISFL